MLTPKPTILSYYKRKEDVMSNKFGMRELAVMILRNSKGSRHYKDLMDEIEVRGWKSPRNGGTPEATLATILSQGKEFIRDNEKGPGYYMLKPDYNVVVEMINF